MKKILLIGVLILNSFLIKAQTNCSTALALTTGTTTTVSAVNGTYGSPCFGGTMTQANPTIPLKAVWYKYTATANGLLTVSSVLATNPSGTTGKDTRVSIFTGSCDNLVCYNGNDDYDLSNNDFRAHVVFPVANGVTYYIAWDNNWSSAGFDFSVMFDASNCLSPNLFDVNDFTDVTVNSASLSWNAAIGNPSGYDIDYGTIGHSAGTGTVVNTTATYINLINLASANNAGFDIYIRANCGATQGLWTGPYYLLLTAKLPYSNGFDNSLDRADGFTSSGWGILTNANVGQNIAESGTGFVFTNTSTMAASNAWLFSRPIDVAAGETVTIKFFSKLLGDVGSTGNFSVKVGNAATAETQQTIIGSVNLQAPSSEYTQSTFTWTADTAGTYFFSFHNNSPVAAAEGSIIVDTITFEGDALGVDDNLINKISVFPNPVNNEINITGIENILIDSIIITDLNGRTVKSINNNTTTTQINVSDLIPGIYFLNITSDKGSITKKIIKQ